MCNSRLQLRGSSLFTFGISVSHLMMDVPLLNQLNVYQQEAGQKYPRKTV
ncbi:MAG: hypothetical protein QNJ53_28775 [Pleurocapsa sp. MO_192.B19]|nr:hypothetical protein [Pleurocapsa sp. MO_192.B19]